VAVPTAARRATDTERALTPVIFGWGTLWWLIAGWREIDRWLAPICASPR
jgi:hypothetical protein